MAKRDRAAYMREYRRNLKETNPRKGAFTIDGHPFITTQPYQPGSLQRLTMREAQAARDAILRKVNRH